MTSPSSSPREEKEDADSVPGQLQRRTDEQAGARRTILPAAGAPLLPTRQETLMTTMTTPPQAPASLVTLAARLNALCDAQPFYTGWYLKDLRAGEVAH